MIQVTDNTKGFISCPFHNEKTASLKIYEDSNSFYCFGCGAGGDIFKFVGNLFNLDFNQTLARIRYDFNLIPPQQMSYRQKQIMAKSQREFKEKQKLLKAHKEYSKQAYIYLCCYRRWLAKQKKTSSIEFDIAYVDRLLYKYLGPDVLIEWDIKARLTALMSKHKKEVM